MNLLKLVLALLAVFWTLVVAFVVALTHDEIVFAIIIAIVVVGSLVVTLHEIEKEARRESEE